MGLRGPPSSYTEEVGIEICRRMAEGESASQVCRDPAMPHFSTIKRWLNDIPEFREMYTQARQDLLEYWADEIIDISDDGSNDWVKRESEAGRVDIVLDKEHIMRSRLRTDNRKWLMSKLAPKKYGDKLELAGEVQHTHRLIIRD